MIQALPEGLDQPERLLADTGYFSEKNVQACQAARIEPLIAVGREAHHPHWRSRFEEAAPPKCAGEPRRTDAARAQDEGRPRRLCAVQADGGSRVRHHQVG